MVDRKHARTHGLAGGGGKGLRLHKQMDGVDGAKLWPNQKADKGEKIAFFHIVKKLASEAGFLEHQAVKVLILGEIDVGKFVRYPLKHVTAPVCLKA